MMTLCLGIMSQTLRTGTRLHNAGDLCSYSFFSQVELLPVLNCYLGCPVRFWLDSVPSQVFTNLT